MFRRAKISVLFTLVGALTASGALLDPQQRHPAFQPGGTASRPTAAVLKPSQTAAPVRLWTGANVPRITPGIAAASRVGLNGFALARAGDTTVAPGAVRKAGGGR